MPYGDENTTYGNGYLIPMLDLSLKEVFIIYCNLEYIRLNDKSYYPSCEICKRKVEENLDDTFECNRCHK